jgi:hypothetical protein
MSGSAREGRVVVLVQRALGVGEVGSVHARAHRTA